MSETDDTPRNGTLLTEDDLAFVATEDGYRVIFSSIESWVTRFSEVADSSKFYVTMRARDAAGNQAVETIGITIDDSNPTALSAETGVAWDSANEKEKAGVLNAVKLELSEPIDADTVDPDDFEIGNLTPSAAVVGTGDNVEDASHNVYLTTQDDLAPDATPNVEVVGSVSDLSGNKVDTAKTTAARVAEDSLGPTVTVTRDNAWVAKKGDEVAIAIASDEKVKAGGVRVSVQGPPNSNANTSDGAKGAKAGDPLMYTVTETIKAAAKTGAYGISVKITDLGTNDGFSSTKVTDEEVAAKNVKIVSPTKLEIKLANGPIADANVDGELNVLDVTVTVGDDMATSTDSDLKVDAVDASGRTVMVSMAGATYSKDAKPTVTVTYRYASADHTFEIDMNGPEGGGEDESFFNIADGAKLTNSSPFIKVLFTDDEYPGDSYTDVSLTAATLTMGDDEMDIADDFQVEANGHNYLWAGVNLALGEYTLAVTGEDTAGNSTDGELTFTIIEKPATQVALTPGCEPDLAAGYPGHDLTGGRIRWIGCNVGPDVRSVDADEVAGG